MTAACDKNIFHPAAQSETNIYIFLALVTFITRNQLFHTANVQQRRLHLVMPYVAAQSSKFYAYFHCFYGFLLRFKKNGKHISETCEKTKYGEKKQEEAKY